GVAVGGDRNRACASEGRHGRGGRGGSSDVRCGGLAGDGAVGRGDVGGGEANRRLAEGEGDDRIVVAVAERAVDDVDGDGRILGRSEEGGVGGAGEVECGGGVAGAVGGSGAGCGEGV